MVADAAQLTRRLTVKRAWAQEHDASKHHAPAATGRPKQLTGHPPRAASTGGHEGQVPVTRSGSSGHAARGPAGDHDDVVAGVPGRGGHPAWAGRMFWLKRNRLTGS
jgi:hypothetical protein